MRSSVVLLGGLVALAWGSGEVGLGELLGERRRGNLVRFLEHDAWPHPLRGEELSWEGLVEWARPIVVEQGLDALLATLWIALAAIVLAGAAASLLAVLGASTLMRAEPYGDGRPRGGAWGALLGLTRLGCVLLRAIPEYVWAFLLLAMLGPGAWPAVLALAVHNAGILGRLGAETIENLDRAPLAAIAAVGAGRRATVVAAAFPMALPRLLLYGFYRFETCVREATVLGMLGTVSIGYWIRESRGRQRYDELLLYVALGALLVIAAEVVSIVARAWVRRA